MRALFRTEKGDKKQVIEAYALAEKAREVTRNSNVRKMSGQDYAARLIQDGIKRKWIYEDT